MKKRTGIFGGSFDPVHTGHIRSASSFLKSGLIDDLLVLLTPDPPHKRDKDRPSYHHRLQMLRLAFAEIEGVTVSDIETTLPLPSYTLQTVHHLTCAYPDTIFYFCVGEDSLASFDTWYKYEEILKKVDLLAAERPGYSAENIPETIRESVIFVDHVPVDISSTRIRSQSFKEIYDCPQTVIDYILTHRLYDQQMR